MSAEPYRPSREETAAPKRRHEPQAEAPGRAPLCTECWHLEDTAGHFWACGWVRLTFRPDLLADIGEAAS